MVDYGMDARLTKRIRIHIRPGIGQQRLQSTRADLDAGTIGFHEDGLTKGGVDRTNSDMTADHQHPRFLLDVDGPDRAGRQIDLLQNKMPIDGKGPPHLIDL